MAIINELIGCLERKDTCSTQVDPFYELLHKNIQVYVRQLKIALSKLADDTKEKAISDVRENISKYGMNFVMMLIMT